MAYVPVLNTAMVEIRYIYQGEPCENTLYFEGAAAFDVPSLTALGIAIRDWWVTDIFPVQSVHASLREVFVTDLTTDSSPAVSVTAGLPSAGAITGEAMANNVAPCISFKTANRGRSFRGRNYLLGIGVDQVSGNDLIPTIVTAYTDAYNGLIPIAGALDLTWVVVSRFSGFTVVDGKKVPTPRAAGLATPIINALFTDTTVDSQRNRLPNH